MENVPIDSPRVVVTNGPEPEKEQPKIDKKEIKILKLQVPIDIRDAQTGELKETIEELRFPRVQVRHMEAMDDSKGETGKMIQLVSALTGHPPHVVRAMDGIDLDAVSEILGHFLGFSPVAIMKAE